MRILYHHRIASKDGQYVHVEELINALKKMGHEVFITGPRVIVNKPFGSGGGFIARLKQHSPAVLYELMEFMYSFLALGKLIVACCRYRPDFVYERYNLFLPAGVWLKRIFRLPLILEVNAPLFEERNKYSGIALQRLARWSELYAWRGADFVLPVTAVLASYVKKAGVPENKIVVIHNGVNLDTFKRVCESESKQHLGLEGKLVLGFVGFMREWHGLEKLVPLLARPGWQNVHLLLVGDGPARHHIEKTARVKGVSDRVTITGVVLRDQVSGYIAAFDIALQPDVVDYASPLKLFEYMAMGVAIVAPAKNNISEILTHQHDGLLFTGGAEGLIMQVKRFVESPLLREQCAKSAQQTILTKGFTWSENAQKVIDIVRSIQTV